MVKRQKTKHQVDALELTEPAQRGPASPRGGVVTGVTRSSARRSSSSGSSARFLQEEPKSSASASLQEEPKSSASASDSNVYEGQTREERDRFWDRQRLNRCQLACRGAISGLVATKPICEIGWSSLSLNQTHCPSWHGPDEELLSPDPQQVSAGAATAARGRKT